MTSDKTYLHIVANGVSKGGVLGVQTLTNIINLRKEFFFLNLRKTISFYPYTSSEIHAYVIISRSRTAVSACVRAQNDGNDTRANRCNTCTHLEGRHHAVVPAPGTLGRPLVPFGRSLQEERGRQASEYGGMLRHECSGHVHTAGQAHRYCSAGTHRHGDGDSESRSRTGAAPPGPRPDAAAKSPPQSVRPGTRVLI